MLVRFALAEALLVGVTGGAAGLAAATLIGSAAFGSPRFGATGTATAIWAGDLIARGGRRRGTRDRPACVA